MSQEPVIEDRSGWLLPAAGLWAEVPCARNWREARPQLDRAQSQPGTSWWNELFLNSPSGSKLRTVTTSLITTCSHKPQAQVSGLPWLCSFLAERILKNSCSHWYLLWTLSPNGLWVREQGRCMHHKAAECFLQHLKPTCMWTVNGQKPEFQHFRSEDLWDHNAVINLQWFRWQSGKRENRAQLRMSQEDSFNFLWNRMAFFPQSCLKTAIAEYNQFYWLQIVFHLCFFYPFYTSVIVFYTWV